MQNFPKVTSPDKLPLLFETLRKNSTPDKITYRYLAKIGFKSSKDRAFLPLLQFLNYIEPTGSPSVFYPSIKDLNVFKSVLLERIGTSYKDVISENARLPLEVEDTVASAFTKVTGDSFETCLLYARTFLGLCRLAGFSDKSISGEALQEKEKPTVAQRVRSSPKINISINLPTTTDKKVYEVLFKHLKELLELQDK